MTLEELRDRWKDLAIDLTDGTRVRMADIAMLAYGGEIDGGILFDSGGEQGNPAWLLKPDEHDQCWQKFWISAPAGEGWQVVGKFVPAGP